MSKSSVVVVVVLAMGIGYMAHGYMNQNDLDKKSRNEASVKKKEASELKKAAETFIRYFNNQEDEAYNFTLKKLMVDLNRKKLIQRFPEKWEKLYKKGEERTGRNVKQQFYYRMRKDYGFFEGYQGEYTQYEIVEVNTDENHVKILARIPYKDLSSGELAWDEEVSTLEWYQYNGEYYIWRGIIFSNKDGEKVKINFSEAAPDELIKKMSG